MKTLLTSLLLLLTSCTALQQDAAKEELKVIGIQIAEAASKAAAETALQAAEAELAKIEASPLPVNPITALARTAAIDQARQLVVKARAKVADFHFTSIK